MSDSNTNTHRLYSINTIKAYRDGTVRISYSCKCGVIGEEAIGRGLHGAKHQAAVQCKARRKPLQAVRQPNWVRQPVLAA